MQSQTRRPEGVVTSVPQTPFDKLRTNGNVSFTVYCGRGSSSANNFARHSPSITPSMMFGRNRR